MASDKFVFNEFKRIPHTALTGIFVGVLAAVVTVVVILPLHHFGQQLPLPNRTIDANTSTFRDVSTGRRLDSKTNGTSPEAWRAARPHIQPGPEL